MGGVLALAGAFSQIVVDGARWIAGGRLSLTPLSDVLAAAAPGRLEALGARLDAAAPWARAILGLGLEAPAFLALAGLAALLLIVARPAEEPRRPL